MNEHGTTAAGIIGLVMAILLVIGLVMWGYPTYRVWSAGMAGEAKLRQAEQEKRILISTAEAERDSAMLQAEAIAIVGKAAKEYPEYRQQQFIAAFGEAIQNGQVKLIFVPTEANVPILQAIEE